jgi:hypothetical protein
MGVIDPATAPRIGTPEADRALATLWGRGGPIFTEAHIKYCSPDYFLFTSLDEMAGVLRTYGPGDLPRFYSAPIADLADAYSAIATLLSPTPASLESTIRPLADRSIIAVRCRRGPTEARYWLIGEARDKSEDECAAILSVDWSGYTLDLLDAWNFGDIDTTLLLMPPSLSQRGS